MEVVREKNIVQPVILTKIMKQDSLLVVDSETTIRYFDKNNLTLLSGFKAKIRHESYKTSVVAFSEDKEYFCAISADARESRLYNVRTKKTVAKVTRHQGEVSCVGIDPRSRYMFSCGEDGKTFAIDMKTGKLVFTLPHHADTINDIAFSKNANWIATAGYDRKISLYNLVTMTPKDKLKAHAAPIMKLRFIKDNRLISADKNSSIIIWDVYNSRVLERLQGAHDEITQITTTADDKFLFVGTKLGYVILYDLDTYKQLARNFVKISSTITALEYDADNHFLIVGTEDGELLFYNVLEGEDRLRELYKQKEFDAINKMALQNPFLAYTDIFDKVANYWDNALEKAKLYLQKGDKKTAELILQEFKGIPAKNTIIQKVMAEYKDFEKFETLARQGKYSLAYSLVNVHPIYKDSAIYRSLEKKWKKVFSAAQKSALEPKGLERARELLAPYRGVSDKTKLIQELFTKGEIYKRFKNAIANKNFKVVFELIKQHPFLKEFPEYDSIMQYADSLYIKASKLLNSGEIHAATKILRVLSNFIDFEDEVNELMRELENKQTYLNALRDENLELIYNLMMQYESFQEMDESVKYIRMWEEAEQSARRYALRGDVMGMKKVLEPFMKIESKIMPIANLFSLCYITQLENAIKSKEKQSVIEKGIKNYLIYFGEQEQILNFFRIFKKYYPESKLNLEKLHHGTISHWRPAMIVNSILD